MFWCALSSPLISGNVCPSVCVPVLSLISQSSIQDVSIDFAAVSNLTDVFVKSCSSVALDKSFSGLVVP